MYSIDELVKYHNQILNMDCIDFIRKVPDNYFDLCCCDPPYGINCDGGTYGLGVAPKKMTKKVGIMVSQLKNIGMRYLG